MEVLDAEQNLSEKDYVGTVLLSYFLGILGVHRFYVGKIGTGILMLITLGGFGIWALVDMIIIIMGKFTDSDGRYVKMRRDGKEVSKKDFVTAALLCYFLGFFGLHRFYTGKIGTGIIMLLTFGGFGIWALVDMIIMFLGGFRDNEGAYLLH